MDPTLWPPFFQSRPIPGLSLVFLGWSSTCHASHAFIRFVWATNNIYSLCTRFSYRTPEFFSLLRVNTTLWPTFSYTLHSIGRPQSQHSPPFCKSFPPALTTMGYTVENPKWKGNNYDTLNIYILSNTLETTDQCVLFILIIFSMSYKFTHMILKLITWQYIIYSTLCYIRYTTHTIYTVLPRILNRIFYILGCSLHQMGSLFCPYSIEVQGTHRLFDLFVGFINREILHAYST